MPLSFNAVDFVHRLEEAGLGRAAAEAIAQGIEERNLQIASRDDLNRLATRQDNEAAVSAALSRQTMLFGVIIAVATAMIIVAVGVIVSLY